MTIPQIVRIPGFLTRELTPSIVNEMRDVQGDPALIYGTTPSGKVDERVRRAAVVRVSTEILDDVTRLLADQAAGLASRFRTEPLHAEPPLFLRYREGDFFVAHQDGNTPVVHDHTRFRRVSISVLLNAPPAYEGGELVFHGSYPDFQERLAIIGEPGELIAFPSETTHEVRPITRGERYAIVSWYRVKE